MKPGFYAIFHEYDPHLHDRQDDEKLNELQILEKYIGNPELNKKPQKVFGPYGSFLETRDFLYRMPRVIGVVLGGIDALDSDGDEEDKPYDWVPYGAGVSIVEIKPDGTHEVHFGQGKDDGDINYHELNHNAPRLKINKDNRITKAELIEYLKSVPDDTPILVGQEDGVEWVDDTNDGNYCEASHRLGLEIRTDIDGIITIEVVGDGDYCGPGY